MNGWMTRHACTLENVEADSITLPMRPAVGNLGNKVNVVTNHMRVTLNDNQAIHQYDVKILEKEGVVVDKMALVKARRILEDAFQRAGDLVSVPVAYDGQKNIFTTNPGPLGR